MDVVFEGRLTPEVQLKVVLQKIFENRPAGNLVVRISSPDKEKEGKMCIIDGRFITAAILNQSHETGYIAVRKLMSVSEGNFACLKAGAEDSVTIPVSLNIELEKIIPLMPNLPESPDGLHDEKSLLDKVFGPALEASESTGPQAVVPSPKPPSSRPQANASWQLLQPLVAPNEMALAPASARSVEGLSQEELDEIDHFRMQPAVKDDGPKRKIRPAKNKSISPLAVISVVGLFLAVQLLAIIFWKPLSAHFLHKTAQAQAQAQAASSSEPASRTTKPPSKPKPKPKKPGAEAKHK